MTQFDYGNIDPNTKSGTALASDLNSKRDAIDSSNVGGSEPTYVRTGMIWADNTTANLVFNAYDGSNSIPVFQLDATQNVARVALDGDEDSYIVADSDDTMRILTGGVERARFTNAEIDFSSDLLLQLDNPFIGFEDTSGATTGIERTELQRAGDVFSIVTTDTAGTPVATEYSLTMGASGATEHAFRIEGADRLTLTDAALSLIPATVSDNAVLDFDDEGGTTQFTIEYDNASSGNFRVVDTAGVSHVFETAGTSSPTSDQGVITKEKLSAAASEVGIGGGDVTLLASSEVTTSDTPVASIEFQSFKDLAYTSYLLVLAGVKPETADDDLVIQTMNGASVNTSFSYGYTAAYKDNGANELTTADTGGAAETSIQVNGPLVDENIDGISVNVEIFFGGKNGDGNQFYWIGHYFDPSSSEAGQIWGAGKGGTATDDGLSIKFTTENIKTISASLFGRTI